MRRSFFACKRLRFKKISYQDLFRHSAAVPAANARYYRFWQRIDDRVSTSP